MTRTLLPGNGSTSAPGQPPRRGPTTRRSSPPEPCRRASPPTSPDGQPDRSTPHRGDPEPSGPSQRTPHPQNRRSTDPDCRCEPARGPPRSGRSSSPFSGRTAPSLRSSGTPDKPATTSTPRDYADFRIIAIMWSAGLCGAGHIEACGSHAGRRPRWSWTPHNQRAREASSFHCRTR